MTDEKAAVRGMGLMALLVLIVLFGLGFLFLERPAASHSPVLEERPDVVFIDVMKAFGPLERPASVFKHDFHTDLTLPLLTEQGCQTCHLAGEDGKLSFAYLGPDQGGQQEARDAYHDGCLGCHLEEGVAAGQRGPDGCGECHQREPRWRSSRLAVAMDKSLHARHVKANEEKCDRCHHAYDEAEQKLYYAKGEEVSCRFCHRQEVAENVSSFRTAAHAACVNCHLKEEDTGPTSCAGCHSAEGARTIAQLEVIPRLQRQQPDQVLIHAAAEDIPHMEQPGVPFNHLLHEQELPSCQICHHEGMQACKECHGLVGRTAVGGVPLAIAYHAPGSDHSCVGCHDRHKTDPGCAGCHTFMPESGLASAYCQDCHAGPSPAVLGAMDNQAPPPAAPWEQAQLTPSQFSADEVPETVTIDRLADTFEPAVFPHQRVVNKLRQTIADSPLATHFHGQDDLACTGCHHHSPVGVRPPRCSNCHGEPFQPMNLQAPGLLGAYHQQCMGCHQKMGMPTECTSCHKERNRQATASLNSAR